MKRAFRLVLILFAMLLVLGLGAIVGLHQYLQSSGGQARLQEELSRALRMPITFKQASLSGSDLRISGLKIRNGDSGRIEVSTIYARYRRWPLLRGTVTLYDLNVENPKIVWTKKAAEIKPKRVKTTATPTLAAETKAAPVPPTVSIPPKPVAVESAAAEPVKTTPAPIAVVPVPQPPVERKTKPAKSVTRKPGWLRFVVEGGQLRHGIVQYLDETQRPIGTVTEINIDCASQPSGDAKGMIEASRIVWASTVVEKLRIPFTYVKGKLELPKVTGKFGDGPFRISGAWERHHPESPFTVAIQFDQVDLDRLTRDTDEPLGLAFGTLRGTAELSGSSKSVESITGKIGVAVREGRLRDFAYCTMIGEPLGIDQFADLRLAESSADLRIADAQVFLDNVLINASDLQVRAKGIVRMDGKLQVAARLIARESVMAHVPGSARDCWTADGDAQFIDFKISGKTHKPKTDLADIIGRKKPGTRFDDLVVLILDEAKRKSGDAKAKGKSSKQDEPPKIDKVL